MNFDIGIGIPCEKLDGERRVALPPNLVNRLPKDKNYPIGVQQGAGLLSGFTDNAYRRIGVRLVDNAEKLWKNAGLILKVKQPIDRELGYLRPDCVLMAFIHSAGNPNLCKHFEKRGITVIALENIQESSGVRPILRAMSKVAGERGFHLVNHYKKLNITKKYHVLVVGYGNAGRAAIRAAQSRRMRVVVIDIASSGKREEKKLVGGNVVLLRVPKQSVVDTIAEHLPQTAIAILAAYDGGEAPALITHVMAHTMPRGAIIADVSCDQGGCTEEKRFSTWKKPVFKNDGVWYLRLPNIPGGYPKISTPLFGKAVFPYVSLIAKHGLENALRKSPALRKGLIYWEGNAVGSARV